MKPYPLKFRPIFKERIWGGRMLEKYFDKDLPPGVRIGESWELADLPQDKSVIANGELAGRTLSEAVDALGPALTGRKAFPSPLPLLLKILDAQDVLSVQVHPDEQTCRRLGKGDPKTECWYIIRAEPGAVIYKGLRSGITRDQFAAAIEHGKAAEMLMQVPVRAGECHFLPAGTAHAIGAGLLIAEIQTPSDTTYRVFDWNRTDEEGKPRQLHIEDAIESINFDMKPEDLPVTTMGRLVESPFFRVDKGCQMGAEEVFLPPGSLRALMIISGRGTIAGQGVETVEISPGNTVLLPAAFGGVMRLISDVEFLRITI